VSGVKHTVIAVSKYCDKITAKDVFKQMSDLLTKKSSYIVSIADSYNY